LVLHARPCDPDRQASLFGNHRHSLVEASASWRFKDDERWCGFIKQATQTKFETLQTELAFLVPPTLKSMARYMNLQSLLGWLETDGSQTYVDMELPNLRGTKFARNKNGSENTS